MKVLLQVGPTTWLMPVDIVPDQGTAHAESLEALRIQKLDGEDPS